MTYRLLEIGPATTSLFPTAKHLAQRRFLYLKTDGVHLALHGSTTNILHEHVLLNYNYYYLP